MRRSLIAACLLVTTAAAYAGDRVPTANILHNGNVVGHCYRTIYTGPDGKLYKREQDCPAPWQNLSSIGVPVVGPAINMDGIREATHFRVKPSGTIVLY